MPNLNISAKTQALRNYYTNTPSTKFVDNIDNQK